MLDCSLFSWDNTREIDEVVIAKNPVGRFCNPIYLGALWWYATIHYSNHLLTVSYYFQVRKSSLYDGRIVEYGLEDQCLYQEIPPSFSICTPCDYGSEANLQKVRYLYYSTTFSNRFFLGRNFFANLLANRGDMQKYV